MRLPFCKRWWVITPLGGEGLYAMGGHLPWPTCGPLYHVVAGPFWKRDHARSYMREHDCLISEEIQQRWEVPNEQ